VPRNYITNNFKCFVILYKTIFEKVVTSRIGSNYKPTQKPYYVLLRRVLNRCQYYNLAHNIPIIFNVSRKHVETSVDCSARSTLTSRRRDCSLDQRAKYCFVKTTPKICDCLTRARARTCK